MCEHQLTEKNSAFLELEARLSNNTQSLFECSSNLTLAEQLLAEYKSSPLFAVTQASTIDRLTVTNAQLTNEIVQLNQQLAKVTNALLNI